MSAERNSAGSRFLRWWMILVCLAASWLCWWGVNSWLEPKPLWSRELPNNKILQPVFEDGDGGKVLITQVQPADNQKKQSVALVVLDRMGGQELYRTTMSDSIMADEYGQLENAPRLFHDAVWRIATTRKNGSVIYELRCWKYREKAVETVVHTWQGHRDLTVGVKWPVMSQVIVIVYFMPDAILELDMAPNPFRKVFIKHLLEQRLLQLPSWCESWQLPDEPGQPLRRLARWEAPAGRSNRMPFLSDDGHWAAFAEPLQDIRQAAQQATDLGYTSFQGNELLSLFRAKSKGILIYNTGTGKLENSFEQDDALHFSIAGWHGSCFSTMSFHAPPDKRLTLKDLDDAARTRNINLPSQTFTQKLNVFRLDRFGVYELKWPESIPRDHAQWYFGDSLNQFNGVCKMDDHSCHFTLDVDRDQLRVFRNADAPVEQTRIWAGWLGNTNQYLMLQPSQTLKWINKSKGKWGWLDSLIKLIRPYLRLENDLVVVDDHSGRSLQHTFQKSTCLIYPHASTQLYLLDAVKKDDEVKHITLSAYLLPLQLYSPWWSWAAACLPFLLLIACVMQRKRA